MEQMMTKVVRVLKTPVTLIVLLLVTMGAGYWGLKAATAPMQTYTTPCVMTDVGSALTPPFVTVRVLNGGDTPNAAKLGKLFLNSHGFRVITSRNADNPVQVTTIVGNSADSPEVKLLTGFYVDAVAQGDGRTDHSVDVILATKSRTVDNPVASLPVKGPVCLPPRTAPSATPSTDVTPLPVATPSTSPTKK